MALPVATPAASPAPFGRTVTAFMTGGLLVTSQIYMLIPLFETLAREWGQSLSTITLLPTVFAVSYGIGQAVWGPASDRFERRLVLSLGVATTGLLTATLASANGLGVALVIVAFQGFAASSFSPGALAHLTHRIALPRRALAVSLLTSSFFAAAVVGQVFAQIVLGLLGWREVLLIAGGAMVATSAWIARVVEPAPPGRPDRSRTAFSAMLLLLRNVRLMLAILGSMAVLGSFVGIYAGLELMGPGVLRDDGALLALRASGLAALVAVPFIVLRVASIDPALRATAGLGTAAAALLLLLAVGDDPVVIGAVLLVFVAAIASTSPAIAQVVARESGAAAGAGMGLWGFFLFIGASGGPQLAALLQPAGFDALLLALSGMLVVAALLLARASASASSDAPVDAAAYS